MEDEGYLTFGENKVAPLSKSRRTAAMGYVGQALASGAPKAIKFQIRLIEEAEASEDLGYKSLGFKASEAILDRFMGKAAQELRIGEVEARPIVFSEKLRALNAGLAAAVKGDAPLEDFSRAVTEGMVDEEGVEI